MRMRQGVSRRHAWHWRRWLKRRSRLSADEQLDPIIHVVAGCGRSSRQTKDRRRHRIVGHRLAGEDADWPASLLCLVRNPRLGTTRAHPAAEQDCSRRGYPEDRLASKYRAEREASLHQSCVDRLAPTRHRRQSLPALRLPAMTRLAALASQSERYAEAHYSAVWDLLREDRQSDHR